MADKPNKPREGDPGHRWQEGHPRFGGRKKRTAQMARDLADELGCDPLAFMMRIINSDVIEQTVIENGKEKRVKVAVDLATRLSAARDVACYLYPKLSATAVTGKNDGPIAVASLDIARILSDPLLSDAAQKLALMVVEQEIAEESGKAEPDYPRYLAAEYK